MKKHFFLKLLISKLSLLLLCEHFQADI